MIDTIEAERALISAMLYSPEACEQAIDAIAPRHFFSESNRKIFIRLAEIHGRGIAPDLVLLRHELLEHGELDLTGGDEYLATLATGTGTNLTAYAEIVREAAHRRALLRIGHNNDLALKDPISSVPRLIQDARQALEEIEQDRRQPTGRFRAAARDASDFVQLEIPRPPSLLGESLLVAGGFAILYGSPGLGKSWLALELGIAIARGEPWLGIPTPNEGASVGVVQLELGEHSLQTRLKALGVGSRSRDAGLKVVCRPALKGVIDLYRRPQDAADLRDWIQHERLSVIVLDAFSRTHTASENTAEEIGSVLSALDALRHETGCAIVLVHHVRKESKDSNPDNHSDEMRGHSRLQSDPTLLMRVVRGHGLKRLVFAKVSEGITPDDICFHIRADGKPEVVESPEATADKNKETIARIISEAGAPIAVSEIESKSGMARRTVQRHLKTLTSEGVVEVSGEKKHARYAPCATMRQDDEWREVSPSAHKALDERWQ